MEQQQLAIYEAQATIIKAMAHPTRLMIIEELSKQEHCVCELTEMVGADTSTVSKHLSVLPKMQELFGMKSVVRWCIIVL